MKENNMELYTDKNPKTTISRLAEILNLTTRAVEKQIAKLKAESRLIRIGSARKGYWETIDKDK